MAAIRRAEATWSGPLATGSGTVSAATTGVFADLPMTWASRTEAAEGMTSPEELARRRPRVVLLDGLSNALASRARRPSASTSAPR